MKRYIYQTILVIVAFLLWGCSEDVLQFAEEMNDPENLRFALRIPEPETVAVGTRGADEAISSLSVLFFEVEGADTTLVCAPKAIEEWSGPDATTKEVKFSVKMGEYASRIRNFVFLFLANLDTSELSLTPDVTTMGQLRRSTLDISKTVGTNVSMSGICTYSDLFNTDSEYDGTEHIVLLRRNVAAVEVKMADSTPLSFSVYGTPDTLSPVAGVYAETPEAESGVLTKGKSVIDDNRAYVAPVLNNSHDAPFSFSAAPFIVVEAPFEGVNYYYRIALVGKEKVSETEEKDEALDVLANHLYVVEVNKVISRGYDSEAAAASGAPSSNIDFVIYDRQPSIFNMASDGQREIGVTDMVEDEVGEECVKEFYVKCFPATVDPAEIIFTPDKDWISVNPLPVETQEVEDYTGQKANLFKFEVTLARNPIRATRRGSVSVSWGGLVTSLQVIQHRAFVADLHSDIKLEILERDGSVYRTITDYWTFLKGEGATLDSGVKGGEVDAPILYGIKPEVNAGRVRTHGLHFPVRNGGRTYRYTVTPDFSTEAGSQYYKVSLNQGSEFADELTFDQGEIAIGTPVVFTFECDGYENQVENNCLLFTAYDSEGNVTDNIAMDMYHTGIFDWSDYPKYRCDRTNDPKYEQAWYYYEVVILPLEGELTCWLDRNIGARSAGFDILDGNGVTIFEHDSDFPYLGGDGSALGGMYHEIASEGVDYGDPELFPDFGPVGYQIPNIAMFNSLRDSHDFITTRAFTPGFISYYQAYFQMENGERVYFPKAGMLSDHRRVSESRTGYYWTSTAATGFEKEEIGKWLSTFVLSGASTSISRSRISNPETGMSARLISVDDNKLAYYQTCFKVQGATHVFLYYDNGKSREWPVAWPGDPVSNPDIAFDRVINYVYESSRNVPYKVIFNYVDTSGAITTMAASNSDKGINATGWDADEGSFLFNPAHIRQME